MIWSFYVIDTGQFTGGTFSGNPARLSANIPAGCAAIEGEFDHLSQRVEGGVVVDWQPAAPADTPDFTHAWDAASRRWVATLTLMKIIRDAHTAIDAAAGAARLRFITDVAGQQAVYLLKLDEARAVLADATTATPHIDAEAAAIGVTREQLAATVAATAAAWNEVASPAIEAARIGGKANVSAAADGAAVASAAAAALAVLAAIKP